LQGLYFPKTDEEVHDAKKGPVFIHLPHPPFIFIPIEGGGKER
jgi:hypothetical protein